MGELENSAGGDIQFALNEDEVEGSEKMEEPGMAPGTKIQKEETETSLPGEEKNKYSKEYHFY